MNVKITVRKYESGNSKTKAFVELKLDNVLIVKGLSLVEGKKGLFLSAIRTSFFTSNQPSF